MADTKDKIKQQRMEEYAKIREELLAEGYIEYNAVISIVKANIMTFVTALPFCILFGILFWVCAPETENSFLDSFFINYSLLIVSFIITIPVHELLHGAGWLISCKNGRKSINFGVI